MWYVAAQFDSEVQAQYAYQRLQGWIPTSGLFATGARSLVKGRWTVLLLGEGDFPQARQQQVADFLREGTLTALSDEVLNLHAARRAQRILNNEHRPLPGQPGAGWAERHGPELMRPGQLVPHVAGLTFQHLILPEPTHQERRPVRLPPPQPQDRTHPMVAFIERYLTVTQVDPEQLVTTDDGQQMLRQDPDRALLSVRLASESVNAVHREKLLKRTRWYLFSESALALHRAVFSPAPLEADWITPPTHLWLWFESPQELRPGQWVQALFLHRTYSLPEMEAVTRHLGTMLHLPDAVQQAREHYGSQQDWWNLVIIRQDGTVLDDLTYHTGITAWTFLENHLCLTGQCTVLQEPIRQLHPELRTVVPCPTCAEQARFWSHWMTTAQRIIAREYALSPEPENQPFPEQQATYEETVERHVGKGKNARKIKEARKQTRPYTVVTFDVSTRARSGQEDRTREAEEVGEGRGNWMTLYGKEALIYERRNFTGISRAYPREHFPHLVERARREGGQFTDEAGRQYTLGADGLTVSGTVLPFEKYVPMLRPEQRKRPVIKRVVAKRLPERRGEE